MAKGKESTRKGKDIGQPNARMKKRRGRRVNPRNPPAPGDTAEAIASDLLNGTEASASMSIEKEERIQTMASDPTSSNNGSASGVVDNEKGIKNRLSGFIFMCNPRTKVECYRYRVFGFPSGKKEVVEEIKPGAKLFLFDFELKLLYGIYEATSAGTLNLEPAAFGGKFPAQVKFKIFKECLPLPGSNLRHLIKENYSGSKFKQELNGNQVNRLVSSFQPLNASSSQLALPTPPNVSQLLAMPPSARGYQLNHTMRPPPLGVPNLTETQYCRTKPLQPTTVSNVYYTQQGYHRPANDMRMVHRALNQQSYLATGGYYVANSQQPYFTGVAREVHGPIQGPR